MGGVVRMTISLTVIILEATNEMAFAPPLMIVLMISKWVGDQFDMGIYDVHIHLKKQPLLEWEVRIVPHTTRSWGSWPLAWGAPALSTPSGVLRFERRSGGAVAV